LGVAGRAPSVDEETARRHTTGLSTGQKPARGEPNLSGQPGARLSVASSILQSYQVSFFWTITVLTALAIALAMPSGRLALFSSKITSTYITSDA